MHKQLPDFILAGTVKSGSTSLYHYLDSHPEVYMSPVKEPHYFSFPDMDFSVFRPLIKKRLLSFNLEKYLEGNMKQKVHRAYIGDWEDYIRLFKNVKNEIAAGEASTSYLWSPGAAERIREKLPQAKVILVLRDPVQRAFSHYLMDLKIKLAEGNFEKVLQADQSVKNPLWGKASMYIGLGMYFTQVKRYFDNFDPSNIHVVLYDDIKKSPEEVMNDLYRFLGVDQDFIPDFSVRHNAAMLPANKVSSILTNNIFLRKNVIDKIGPGARRKLKKIFYRSEGIPQLSQQQKSALLPFFAEDIVSLQKLIKKDLSHWLR